MKKIMRVSRLLKFGAVGVCVALPLVEAGYWITNGYPFLAPFFQFEGLALFGLKTVWDNLNAVQKFLGFLINMIPLAFSMIALSCLAKLFAAFEKMSLFERENVRILNRAGKALVYGQLIYPLYTILLSLVLTYRNPVGERAVSIVLGPHQFEILTIGLSILLASWVFQEAVYLHEEQEATV